MIKTKRIHLRITEKTDQDLTTASEKLDLKKSELVRELCSLEAIRKLIKRINRS